MKWCMLTCDQGRYSMNKYSVCVAVCTWITTLDDKCYGMIIVEQHVCNIVLSLSLSLVVHVSRFHHQVTAAESHVGCN